MGQTSLAAKATLVLHSLSLNDIHAFMLIVPVTVICESLALLCVHAAAV